MRFSNLQLAHAQRFELLAQSRWSIEEAACYFCDVRAVELDKLSPDELQVLHETELIYDIEELTRELPDSFSNSQYFRTKYKNLCITKKSLFSVEEFMLWANEQWPLTHGTQLPRIVLEYNYLKELKNCKYQENTMPCKVNQEFNSSPNVVEMTTQDPEVQEVTPATLEDKSESALPPDVIEKFRFLHDRGVRIDLWISLCYDCYRLWWNDSPHPVGLPPVTTNRERDKRDADLAKEKATYDSWFIRGAPYASMNRSHVYEVIGGLLDPKNPGGRRPGSKNLLKRSSRVSDTGNS